MLDSDNPSSADIVVAGQMAALLVGTRVVDGSSPGVRVLDGAPLQQVKSIALCPVHAWLDSLVSRDERSLKPIRGPCWIEPIELGKHRRCRSNGSATSRHPEGRGFDPGVCVF